MKMDIWNRISVGANFLTVDSIWEGGTSPPNRRKNREKTGNAINMIFTSVTKILLDNFRNFISSGGLSRDHCWRDGVTEIHDFKGFWSISQWVFDIWYLAVFCTQYEVELGSHLGRRGASKHCIVNFHRCPT